MTVGIAEKFTKQSWEKKPWTYSMERAFAGRTDTPASVELVVSEGLTATASISGTDLLLTVEDGVNGGVYDITAQVTTSTGKREEFDFVVKIKDTPSQYNETAQAPPAQSSAAQAKGSAEAAAQSESNAAGSAVAASQAASAAGISAGAAHDDRVRAETERAGAEQAESNAEQAAQDADASKLAAAQSEGLAAQHKLAAQDAATAAGGSATAAATSATSAATSETNAAASAVTAASAAAAVDALYVENVAALRALPAPSKKCFVNLAGYYAAGDGGGGQLIWMPASTKVDNGGTVFAPSSNPASGRWIRQHGYEVSVAWFGAKGDAARPSSAVPDGNVTGTDDTVAIKACRDYLQTIAFQPNLYVGNWGGFCLTFEPNKCYRLIGNNPLGSSRPRSVLSGDAGSLARQNWQIDGKGALLVWEVTDAEDALIEANEAFVVQHYCNFSVIVAKAVGSMGAFFSNIANSGRNATQRHKFERVQVYHAMPSSTTHGLKYMFRYLGDNLGDRLITEQCSFNQAHTHFYSENGEAVQQSFESTTFASYLDGSIFFHLRRHGSTFSFGSGTGFLVKGDNQTLFRAEYMPDVGADSGGANTYMNVKGCRLECEGGMRQTLANCDFGVLEIDGVTMAAGGMPADDSKAVIVRKTGVVRVRNSHLHGRLVVGIPNTSTNVVRRAYAIKLEDCQFSMDMGKAMYVEAADGSLVRWRDAVVGAYQVPAIVIRGTDTKSATWEGRAADANSYVFDGLYPCNPEYSVTPWAGKLMVGRYRTASQNFYLDNRLYAILPPLSTITSIRITHAAVSNTLMDTLAIKVGSARLYYALPNNAARRNYELLIGQALVISDDDVTERTIGTSCRLGGNLGAEWSSPSFIAFLEIEYRPAYGKNEIYTVEDSGGVRSSRLV